VKIVGVGAGPAALYFSILAKREHPEWDITLLERNARDNTFGWGVVFSDETLGNLFDADPPTHAAITRDFAHWNEIDVHYRGEVIRSRGHGFSGIGRQRLLDILGARAQELGVAVRYESEVGDPKALAAECDLLLGADGIRSGVRAAWADEFQPSLDQRRCMYTWLGTTKLFDAFTFIFAEHPDVPGAIFQVHAYRFDTQHSTFIVECDERSWRDAGLHEMPFDDAVRWLEALFAPWLDGHPLLQNRSSWVRFATVRNARWSVGNVVLLGDAVHTAHFSIGSGTKLAMEDAIALAESFREGRDVPAALAHYEAARRPMTERIQKAAQDSLTWFEQVRRHRAMEPAQFAFSLLTRSKKITYENLGVRDEAFLQRTRAWFAARTGAAPETPPIFTPLTLRGLTLENRVVVSPMCMYSAEDGAVNDFHLAHYGARAMGGAGLVMCEMTDVTPDGRITPGCAGMYAKAHVEAWRRVTDLVHRHSRAKVGLQLGHAGRKGSTAVPWEGGAPLTAGAWPLLAPSPIPYREGWPTPREMDDDAMDVVLNAFVEAAVLADEAGFDVLELHCAHGYLLGSFLSPLTNRRTDEYGGGIEGRSRFPLAVWTAMRIAWPAHKPMSVRVSATDWAEGGITDDDIVAFCRELKKHGCDLIDVSTGMTVAEQKPLYGRMFQAPWSELIRNEVGIPTVTVGAVTTADQVNTLVAAGRADLCALARPHLADPSWTLHAAAAQGWEGVAWPPQYELARPPPRR